MVKNRLNSPMKIRMAKSDIIYSVFCVILLIAAAVLILFPLMNIVSSSFSDPNAVVAGEVFLLPVRPTLLAYQAVFNDKSIMTGFYNSVIYTIVGTTINLVVTVAYAYPLSLKTFYGRNVIMIMLLFTMYFSGGLIPTYLVVSNLNMTNTVWALVIPGAVSVYQIIVCRTFFQNTIPRDLYDAASIDGCGDIKCLFSVVLPNSKAILAVLVLMFAVGHWNTFFTALIYISDPDKYPLQLILRDILIGAGNTSSMLTGMDIEDQLLRENLATLLKYSTIVVGSLPMMILYPFAQKYFIKGVMIGSVKG